MIFILSQAVAGDSTPPRCHAPGRSERATLGICAGSLESGHRRILCRSRGPRGARPVWSPEVLPRPRPRTL